MAIVEHVEAAHGNALATLHMMRRASIRRTGEALTLRMND